MAMNSLFTVALTTTVLTVLAAGLDGLEAAAANTHVGVTSGTTTHAHGTPPQRDRRLLDTGTKMFFEEQVVTDPTGRAQLLFEDGSSMTIGPQSDLVIDRFVYDPEARSGEMVVSLTKGIVRFVGGRISKKRAVQFKTPVGTMGIRGGIAVISVEPAGGLEVDFLFGQELTLEVDGTVQTTTTPGTFIAVSGAGEAPSQPQRRTPEVLNRRLQAFEAGSGDRQEADSNTPENAGPATAPGQGQIGGQSVASEPVQQAESTGQDQSGAPNRNLTAEIETQVAELGSFERQQEEQAPAGFEIGADLATRDGSQQESGGLDVPSPRPEQDRPQDFVTPVTEVVTEPVAEVVPIAPPTETIEPTPVEPPPTVEPEPDSGSNSSPTSSPTSFSRSFGGFAFRGNTSYATNGANVTTSDTLLGNRRFSSASASGSDETVGGTLTATNTAGSYELFYPAPQGSSPVSYSSCPGSLSCTTTIAGSTPSSVSGQIENGNEPDFVGYPLVVDGEFELMVFGKEYTGAVLTTGATKYKMVSDPFFADSLPFARTTDSGLASNIEPSAIVKWSSSATSKPFVSSSFEYNQTNGTSVGSVLVGRVSGGATPYISGFGYGSVDTTGTTAPQFYKGGMFTADTDDGKDFFGNSEPDFFVLNSVEDSDTSVVATDGVSDLTGAGTTYYPVAPAEKSGNVTIAGGDTTLTNSPAGLIGFHGGAGTVAGTAEAFRTTSATGNTSFLTISSTADTVDTSIAVTGSGGTTITTTTSGAVSAYVSDEAFASQLTGGTISAGAEANIEGVVATHGDNSGNFELCSSCDFLKWGFWSLRMNDQNASLHMASWVSGISTTIGTLSGVTSGSATYTGNVIGTVIDSGATALKTGTFSTDISFSGSTASVTLNSFAFDGNTFTGSGSVDTTFTTSSVNGFALTDTSSVAGKTLDMRGALFGTDGTNPPPELGGDFRITGTGYAAGGVYAGKK